MFGRVEATLRGEGARRGLGGGAEGTSRRASSFCGKRGARGIDDSMSDAVGGERAGRLSTLGGATANDTGVSGSAGRSE
jgi:hypothetical protein